MTKTALALAAAIGAFACGTAAAGPLVLVTEENPPYNFTDQATGKVSGIAAEIVQTLMARTGVEYRVEVLPWNRAYASARENADTCIFAVNETEERKPLFTWIGPLSRGGTVLFTREDSAVTLASLDDAKPFLVGVQQNSAAEKMMAEKGVPRVEAVPDAMTNARKLAAGRIDLWVSGLISGPYQAKVAGIGKVKPVLVLNESVLSMACNPGVDAATVAKLNAELTKMRGEGLLEATTAKYQ